jgi:hypothetical protein
MLRYSCAHLHCAVVAAAATAAAVAVLRYCCAAQVSTEYSSYKREAEVKLEQLEEERDNAREELQLAMVAGSVSH